MGKSIHPLIQISRIVKNYLVSNQPITALNNISLTIHSGEMLAIVGASGSGKSTLMNLIGLLDQACSGDYHLAGQDTANLTSNQRAKLRNQSIGFIFQQFYLLPRLNALDNIALPLLYRQQSMEQAQYGARLVLKKLGMGLLENHYPHQLSGGQQQRIAIARAIVGNPHVLLADEPTGALDSKTRDEIMTLFHQLNQEGSTIILVTHDEHIAQQCSRRILLEQGEISQ